MEQKTQKDIKFIICRETYPEWYSGMNAYGPTWTSFAGGAAWVDPSDLVVVMVFITAHEPSVKIQRAGDI